MSLLRKIREFCHEGGRPVEFGVKSRLLVLFFTISIVFLLINAFFFRYPGISYLHPHFLLFAPAIAVTSLLAWMVRRESPRVSFFFLTLGTLYGLALLFQFGCYAIQFTPFHLMDNTLYHFDQLLGFSSAAVVQFAQHHPIVEKVSHIVYQLLEPELFLIPLVLALFMERRQINVFFIACLVSGILGYSIYYFFPTTDPANVVHGITFSKAQYEVIAQFYGIHTYQKEIMSVGGLIGFPSFHVIWATILMYVCKNRKILFYPMLLVNSLLIISTLTLGWHFLASVMGGFAIAAGALYLAERWTVVFEVGNVLSVKDSLRVVFDWIKEVAQHSLKFFGIKC